MSEALSAFLTSPSADAAGQLLLADAQRALTQAGWSVETSTPPVLAAGTWPSRTWTGRLLAPGGPEDLWFDVRAEFHPSKVGVGLSQRWTLQVRWGSKRWVAGVTALNSAYHVLLGGQDEQVAQLTDALEKESRREPGWSAVAAAGLVEMLSARLQP